MESEQRLCREIAITFRKRGNEKVLEGHRENGERTRTRVQCSAPSRNTRDRPSASRLCRIDTVAVGDRARLARTGRRPADQIERTDIAPNDTVSPRAEAIAETPMAATGTVAIPFSTESFRLSDSC